MIEDIRSEIKAVLKEHDGFMSPQALAQMRLLDSAIKESQRMHPLGLSKSSVPTCALPPYRQAVVDMANTVP